MRNNHAFLHRIDARAWWCALALGCVSLSAQAYVSPSPPPGFGGTPGAWTHTPPSASEQIGKIMRGPGPKIPGGPVAGGAFRLGGGAARALAGGVARGLLGPVGLALGLAWLASNCIGKVNGQWTRTCFVDDNGQPYTPPQSDGYQYTTNGQALKDTREESCSAYAAIATNATFRYEAVGVISTTGGTWGFGICQLKGFRISTGEYDSTQNVSQNRGDASNCPAGWYKTPAGCVSSLNPQPLTVEQVEEEMATKPLPQQLPPGFPYPLDPDAPFIFEPDTANPPNAQPIRVPQGNPVPVPNTNPQQYRQPVTRFTPAPTRDDPFRLDARPEDLITNSPTGITGPTPVTPGTPNGEKPEQFDLCKEHPDIIACQKIDFDTPDGEIPKDTKQVTFQEQSLFGGGSCPADRMMTIQRTGQTVKAWDWAQACNLMLPIRAIVMTLATFAAFLIVMPGIGGKST